MIYIGKSECRHCGTIIEGRLDKTKSPTSRIGDHKFIQNAIKGNGDIETTYQCHNCQKEDSLILKEVL